MIHLAIHTTVGGTVSVAHVEITALFQLTIHVHLFLRVHDVELTIGRFQTKGELASIIDTVGTRASFLGGYHDDACHSLGSIDRGSRAVFQYLKALDVVGIQSGYGIGDKCFGIARRQVVSIYLGRIFHDNTIDHPERFGRTKDGRGTTHTNLRSCTEGTAHVLYRHTGSTSFERTADISHTVEFGIRGINFGGGSGKQTLVHGLHTCYHHIVQRVAVVFENDVGGFVGSLAAIGLHAYIRIFKNGSFCHILQFETTAYVGDCHILGSYFLHAGTYQRVTVRIEQMARDGASGSMRLALDRRGTVDLNKFTIGGCRKRQICQ